MESELETLQAEKNKLGDEMEVRRKTCSSMEQQIQTITNEVRAKTSKYWMCKS